jgi:creatinine amidohydrolase/Fe(II)-dependent formamide hydrolase-like protein
MCSANKKQLRYQISKAIFSPKRESMRMKSVSSLLPLVLPFLALSAMAQILQMAELSASQIGALDRAKTVILIPGGILEEHGPYLPSFTDGYADAAFTQELARALVGRPGWTVVVFPQIPLGFGGANNIGGKYVFPGSYTVRMSTLRAVYMDLGTELGEQGFRWIFLIHNHGDPQSNRALDEAGDFFHDVYGGHMVQLFGLQPVMECCGTPGRLLAPPEQEEEGFTVHAGVEEHSQMLFLRPDLVAPAYRKAPSITGKNFKDLYHLAEEKDWPGYFGAPRFASAAFGAQDFAEQTRRLNQMAIQILDGFDYRKLPRFADEVDPRDAIGQAEELEHAQKLEKKELDWLESKGRGRN